MTVVDINSSNILKNFIEELKIDCEALFNKVDESGEIYIINNFPAVTDKLGKISLLFLINIPYKQGSYYCFNKAGEQRKYLNSLAFGINFVTDPTMISIDENNYISEEGLFSYKDELENESVKFNNWVYQTFNENHNFNPFFRCVFFDWVRADNLKKKFENEYVIVNKKLSIRYVINAACNRIFAENNKVKLKGCSSFSLKENMNLSKWVQILIEKANEQTTLGILTKKKLI